MVSFKVVIGTKAGTCVQKEIQEPEAKALLGKKIGDKIAGDALGFAGYEFKVTGGSDYCGFPMRKDVEGFGRKRVLEVSGIGLKKKAKGIRQRKTVCGNAIHPKITQVNLSVLTEGKEPLVKPEGAPEGEAPAEEKPAEAPKEEKPVEAPKEEPKAEEKPAEEKPAETPKEEAKAEETPAEAPKEEAKAEEKPAEAQAE